MLCNFKTYKNYKKAKEIQNPYFFSLYSSRSDLSCEKEQQGYLPVSLSWRSYHKGSAAYTV